jgi:hypothetical protein
MIFPDEGATVTSAGELEARVRVMVLEARIAAGIERLQRAYRDWDADRDHRVGKEIANAVKLLKGEQP